MHACLIRAFGAVAVAALATTTGLGLAPAQAAGNLASQPTYLETTIEGPGKTLTGTDFDLEVGKYYIWEITSDGTENTLIEAPGLFRNAWFNQLVVNDREIHTSGALYGIETGAAGTIAVSFVPVRPGDYTFSVSGGQTVTGTFHVSGASLAGDATPIDLDIDTARLAFSRTEFELETGKAYRLNLTSDGIEELGVMMPELLRNSWLDQLVIDDIGVILNGAFSSVEYDDEGTVAISFVPIRPGNYTFYAPGYEAAGLTGTFVVR